MIPDGIAVTCAPSTIGAGDRQLTQPSWFGNTTPASSDSGKLVDGTDRANQSG
jgi:hypothetical protein